MDPFRKLLPELRLQLLVSLRSFKEALTFSHASPALFRQRQESKVPVMRHYIKKDLDDDFIQDALAIILFPELDHDIISEGEREERAHAVDAHLRKWGAKKLPNPLEPDTRDIPKIHALYSLCRRLWLYIEDYLSKATSRHLPRAYRQLPKWSHPHFSRSFTQRHLAPEVNPFDLNSLTQDKRRRILGAFLRYELLCRIYGPAGGKLEPKDDRCYQASNKADEYDGYRFDQNDPFRYWDWSVLYKYEEREPEPRDLQLLPCVREYVLTVYGALITDQVRAGLPSAGEHPEFENAPLSGMGRFPDYDPDSLWEDLHRLGGTGWSDVVVSLMATAGFDLLTSTLASSGVEFRKFILAFNREVLRSPPMTDATNVNLPISAPSRRRRIAWHCNDFIRLHRQRAWALFEDDGDGDGDGDHGDKPRLPTEDEYRELYGPGPVDGLVGWGLEMDDTRNERICHGPATYPSLSDKLVPFWKRGDM